MSIELPRIVAAAVRYGDLVVCLQQPARHHHILHAVAYALPGVPRQGFLTSNGVFVSRKAAWKIASAAGQLLERAPTDGRGAQLYSEDVLVKAKE